MVNIEISSPVDWTWSPRSKLCVEKSRFQWAGELHDHIWPSSSFPLGVPFHWWLQWIICIHLSSPCSSLTPSDFACCFTSSINHIQDLFSLTSQTLSLEHQADVIPLNFLSLILSCFWRSLTDSHSICYRYILTFPHCHWPLCLNHEAPL